MPHGFRSEAVQLGVELVGRLRLGHVVLFRSPIGPVIVPEPDPEPEANVEAEPEPEPGKDSAHSEIQLLLLKLGNDMGLDVWAARNDRNREYRGRALSVLPRVRFELPLKFDPVTNRTIELIDVLWLKSNAIVAAFEVESSTSIIPACFVWPT